MCYTISNLLLSFHIPPSTASHHMQSKHCNTQPRIPGRRTVVQASCFAAVLLLGAAMALVPPLVPWSHFLHP